MTRATRGTAITTALLAAALAAGCSDGKDPISTAPDATVSLALATPNADDGALLFTVSGPSILGVTPAAGVELAESRATANGATTSTIVVRGNLASGVIATMTVRGAHADSPYTVQIREAAARASGNYAQRSDLSQYRVTVQK
jgi:hypothetical protein